MAKNICYLVMAALCMVMIVAGCNKKEVVEVNPNDLVSVTVNVENEPSQPTVDENGQVNNVAKPTPAPGLSEVHIGGNEPEPEKIVRARSKNSDVIGWVTVPNTKIDYPVLLAADNEYYLDKNIDKKKSKSGAIYLDYRNNDPKQQKHLIIYGHNMKNGTMFHDLNSYKLKDFLDNSKVIEVWLFGKKYFFEVYSQYIATVDIDIIRTKFDNDANFISYMDELKVQAKYPTDVKFAPEDVVLSLITCTYEYDNSRCVVQARQIEK